jgi:glutamine synthetase
MSAIVKAVDDNGDLMRMAISSPGNDFRLGACEAPPSIISVYLGDDMTKYLEAYKNGDNKAYQPTMKTVNLGASVLAPVEIPAEDRNRTSPFPYGGHRFEFRAVGSSQNVSLVNTVLNTITAKAFKEFADAIEKGSKPVDVARGALNKAWRVVFNGNGYDPKNQEKLTKDGLWRIDSGVDAICRYTNPKNVALFEEMKVFSAAECSARQTVMLSHYLGTVEIEVLTLIDMLVQHIIPSVKEAKITGYDLEKIVATLKKDLAEIHHTEDLVKKAQLARKLRLETMIDIRTTVDEVEGLVPAHLWTLATYKDLLFLDQHHQDY